MSYTVAITNERGNKPIDWAAAFEAAGVRLEQRKAEHAMAVAVAREEMQAVLDTCRPDDLEDVLMRQGHVLDTLLRRTLHTHAGPAMSSHGLELILKTQRGGSIAHTARATCLHRMVGRFGTSRFG